MKRIYEALLTEHLAQHRQMALVAGPRQVGKTTCAIACAAPEAYVNWDRQSDRQLITRGPDAVAERLALDRLAAGDRSVIFDEIHKYARWKDFLKGFFDTYGNRCRIIVTGSARLTVHHRSGDSLMGRYFLYRMHPLTIAELERQALEESEIRPPQDAGESALRQLMQFGGFPEPYLKASTRFSNRWKRLRLEQLFQEDLRDLTQIHEAGQMEVLARILTSTAGQLLNYSSLAADVNVSVDTIRRWIAVLESLYYCFTVRPWFRNVPKSLRKQPKVYLWDWSLPDDSGARQENLVASHLLKAVHWWTDMGLGEYGLYHLRDTYKREVDFLVTRNQEPWFLVEVKSSDKRRLNPNLDYFQNVLGARHAFQVSLDSPYVDRDCFSIEKPVGVPALTFLSQLV